MDTGQSYQSFQANFYDKEIQRFFLIEFFFHFFFLKHFFQHCAFFLGFNRFYREGGGKAVGIHVIL